MVQVSKHLEKYLAKNSALNCGLGEGYLDAEVFLLYVSDPEKLVSIDLNVNDPVCIDINSLDLVAYSHMHKDDVFNRVFCKCVEQGFEFDKFIDVCRETSVMDKFFMSQDFMDNVHAGSIHGHYYVKMQGEDINDYRTRFKQFISFLDEKFNWTAHYVQPNDFWGMRVVYWI